MCLWCLTCAVAVTSFLPCFRRYAAMFGACLFIYVWQVVSCHVLACLVYENASSGALQCVCDVWACAVAVTSFWPCFRRYAAMFDSCLFIYVWQVESWHDLACLCPARWLTDMFWHVYTGMFMLPCLISVYLYMFDRCSPDMSSGQEMTSVQQKKCCVCQCFEMSWWGSLEVK